MATLIPSCGFMIAIVATSTKRLVVTKSTFICTLKKRTLLLMHFLENKRLQKGTPEKYRSVLSSML